MKKIVFIIIGLLCAFTVSAVSYASPYKGSGYYSGPVYVSTSTMGMAQTPAVTMSSTSLFRGHRNAGVVGGSISSYGGGISTSASSVTGGVTTYNAAAGHTPHKARKSEPDVPELEHCDCTWYWDEGRHLWVCSVCGATLTQEKAELEGLFCPDAGEDGHCHCGMPLEFGLVEWLFMAVFAGAYALYKIYKVKKYYGEVQDGREMVA